MPRWTVALASCVVALRAVVAQAPPPPPPRYRVIWWDAASVAGGGALAAIPEIAGLPHGPPPCAPCDPASLPGIDRAALHTFSGPAGTTSTVLLAGVTAFAALASTVGVDGPQVRGHAVVFANALAWTAATTEWLKVLAHRSRPVLYTAAAPAAASDRDNRRSFPSTHAAAAFSLATAYLVMARRERLPHRARNAVLLFGGAAAVAALRVAAGQHFPTDVVAGATLGGGIGWLVARVHPTAP
ncbi:MAG TPA: phosphatase PAP2 family protein [Gemmatimonadales bacterium]|nr:phosphatase PAP2 family protein [Gemmatimonadales bacterium]